jgi:PAS domain S-box-containing protein
MSPLRVPGRVRVLRWTPALVVGALVALCLALGAGVAVVRTGADVARERDGQAALLELSNAIRQTGYVGEEIQSEGHERGLARELASSWGRARVSMRRFVALDDHEDTGRVIAGLLEPYARAQGQQVAARARGDRATATAIDNGRTDPALARLLARLDAMHLREAADVDGLERRQVVVSSFAVGFALLAGLALLIAVGRSAGRARRSELASQWTRAESAALAASEERFRALFDNSPAPIYVHDSETLAFIEVSEAAAQLYGWSREEMLGMSLLDIVPAEHHDRVRSTVADDREDMVHRRLQSVHQRSDGTRLDVIAAAQTMQSDGRRVSLVVVEDITEQEQMSWDLHLRLARQTAMPLLGKRLYESDDEHDMASHVAETLATALGIDHLEIALAVHAGGRQAPVVTRGSIHSRNDLVRVPIAGGDGSIGTLTAGLEPGRELAPDERAYVETIAQMLSSALERRRREEALRELALRDAPTGLATLAGLEAVQRTAPAAIALIRIDRFRLVTDSLGAAAGDELVRGVAQRLRALTGAPIARLEGGEFAVSLEQDGAMVAAEVLRKAFDDPFLVAGLPRRVTVVVALADIGDEPDGVRRALEGAGTAIATADDRDLTRSVQVFDDERRARVVDRLALEHDLRAAVEADDDQFVCHYQPIVSLRDGRTLGHEALVRWQHPVDGFRAPDSFIPLAEETGLIGALGERVLLTACRQTAAWRQAGDHDGLRRVSVNLSVRQLADPEVVGMVGRALAATGLEPGALTLEITETSLLEDAETAQANMLGLAALGVRLVLDDFGTGFSSMAYLSRLPVSGIKIDRSFVARLGQDGQTGAIVEAMLSMAAALDLTVVAEGVETAEQAAMLLGLGCSRAQGWLFGRPMPASEARAAVLSPPATLAALAPVAQVPS